MVKPASDRPWPAPGATSADATRPAFRTLVTGGTRSGKSHWAEQQLHAWESVLYLATGPEPGDRDDSDWAARVQAHQQRRPAGWVTWPTLDLVAGLSRATREHAALMIDDLGGWVSGTLDATEGWTAGAGRYQNQAAELAAAWAAFGGRAVLVSSEVGSSVHPASASGRMFTDELGRLTTTLAQHSTEVVLVVAGLPLWLKSADPTARRKSAGAN